MAFGNDRNLIQMLYVLRANIDINHHGEIGDLHKQEQQQRFCWKRHSRSSNQILYECGE
jgi:hypothetical protein